MADKVKKLPGDVSHLQRLIGGHAPERDMPPARLHAKLHACTEVFGKGLENDRVSRRQGGWEGGRVPGRWDAGQNGLILRPFCPASSDTC